MPEKLWHAPCKPERNQMANPLLNLANPSVMGPEHNFSMIPEAQIQRSTFDRSHRTTTTVGSGFLVPFMADEVYPGDTFNQRNLAAVIRMITPIVPFMDNLYCDWFWFFVPLRLVWSNFQRFMGEQENPGDTTDYIIPKLDTMSNHISQHSPYDYMGVPPLPGNTDTNFISALFGRAFNLTYNKWFRDQNLQNSYPVPMGDGPDPVAQYQDYGVNNELLPRRGKRHDYFTSSLPWPQKINDGTVVTLPLGTTAPVNFTAGMINATQIFSPTPGTVNIQAAANQGTGVAAGEAGVMANSLGGAWGPENAQIIIPTPVGVVANLAGATGASINAIRLSITMQQLFERDARGGTYYPEILRSHFGVISPDARVQWPEYLGGGETPIQIQAVPQTSATGLTGGATPAGNLTAFAAGHETGKISWTKSFVEHGILLGILSIRADLTYQQGLRKMFSRSTRYDFYWPTFANLGEQAVLNKEIFLSGTSAQDNAAFGYQEAWSELRYYPSEITAGMRSAASPSFAIWHLSQNFGSLPHLNAAFIEDTPPINRVTAVSSTYDQFYVDVYVDMHCTRPMPMNSVPGLTRV